MTVLIDLADLIQLERRLKRDVKDDQIVRPAHDPYIRPTRQYADFLFPGDKVTETVETIATDLASCKVSNMP